MPKAAKSTTRASAAASSRTDPLRSKNGKGKSNGTQKNGAAAASTVKSEESASDQEDVKQSIKPEIKGEDAKTNIKSEINGRGAKRNIKAEIKGEDAKTSVKSEIKGKDAKRSIKHEIKGEDAKTSIKPEINGEDAKTSIPSQEIDTKSNYLLMVHMTLSDDPMISRLLSLPPHLTFDKFHHVLQIAFGWANCHMHSFNVTLLDPDAEHPYPRPVAYLKPRMDDIDMDMGFIEEEESDYTLHDVFSRAIFSRPVFRNTEWEASKVSPKMELGLEYEYDHGDSWTHQITLLGRADPSLHRTMGGPSAPSILCLGGEGHPCAEDCGSAPGWEHLKELFAKPRKRDSDDLKDWYKNQCANGDSEGLDPWKWDIVEVNEELGSLEK